MSILQILFESLRQIDVDLLIFANISIGKCSSDITLLGHQSKQKVNNEHEPNVFLLNHRKIGLEEINYFQPLLFTCTKLVFEILN